MHRNVPPRADSGRERPPPAGSGGAGDRDSPPVRTAEELPRIGKSATVQSAFRRCAARGARLAAALLALASAGFPVAPQARRADAPREPAPRPAQADIDAAIDRGVAFLLAREQARGAGDGGPPHRPPDAGVSVGECALTLYTLLEAGVPREDPVVRELLARVLSARIHRTYDAACALLALEAHDPSAHWRWIRELALQLTCWQNPRGDWGYPSGDAESADLSNTQYAALGLWVATSAGVRVEQDVFARLCTAVRGYQQKDGGFSYARGAPQSTGSMTAAGVGTLAIGEIGLRLAGELDSKAAGQLANARAAGLEWLAREFSAETNPRSGAWVLYYLYGLERLGAATGVERIGGRDWYGEGAAFLVGSQAPSGGWVRGGAPDTCFAILFLKRATGARRFPATGPRAEAAGSGHAVQLSARGAGPVELALERFEPALQRELEWEGERGLGPRVARVEYLADGRTLAVVLGDSAGGATGQRFGAQCLLARPGPHALQARVHVVDPAKPRGPLRVLESQVVHVDAARARPRWAAELDADLGPELGREALRGCSASSHASGPGAPLRLDHGPERAMDGSGAVPWLAAADDERRVLTIELERAVETDVLRVSPAVLPALGAEFLARPVEIEVVLDGRVTTRLLMDPDPLHPIRWELARRHAVRRIELRIVSVAPSAASPHVGIGEVELFRRR